MICSVPLAIQVGENLQRHRQVRYIRGCQKYITEVFGIARGVAEQQK